MNRGLKGMGPGRFLRLRRVAAEEVFQNRPKIARRLLRREP
jgi:hypothetical protein